LKLIGIDWNCLVWFEIVWCGLKLFEIVWDCLELFGIVRFGWNYLRWCRRFGEES
jgi:hypothetical protein